MIALDSGGLMSRIQFYSIYDRFLKRATVSRLSTAALAWMMLFQVALASDFTRPWRDNTKALILDAYELNSLDWLEITKNKRIVGFIGKASDGLSAEYCPNSQTLCGAKWPKYAVTKELYHTGN